MVAVIIFSILFNMPRYFNWHTFRKPDGSLVNEKSYLGDHDVYQLVYLSTSVSSTTSSSTFYLLSSLPS